MVGHCSTVLYYIVLRQGGTHRKKKKPSTIDKIKMAPHDEECFYVCGEDGERGKSKRTKIKNKKTNA